MNFEESLMPDITEAVKGAFKSTESPATSAEDASQPPSKDDVTTPPSPDAKTPVSGGERARDESGKFAKAAEEKKPIAQAETVAGAQPQAPIVPTVPTVAPPSNWKGAGKVEWNRLPAPIQKELVDEYSRVSKIENEYTQIKTAIGDDRAQQLAANYGSVPNGLQNLFALSDFATKNPAGFIQWFAQQRGISLPQSGQTDQPGSQPADPANPFMQKISTLENQLSQLQQHLQTAQTAPLQAEIQAFQSDPAHPYFNDVRLHMKALIESGGVQGTGRTLLENAYKEAIWARSDIRERLLEDERKKFVTDSAAKVAEAKKANGSITGSPAGAKVTDEDPEEDLEATVRKAVRRAGSR